MNPTLRAIPIMTVIVACHPHEETGEPRAVDPWLSDTTWELHEEIASIVRVGWWQEREGASWVEYRVDADDWRATPVMERGQGEHEQLLLGVPYDSKLQLRVAFEAEGTTLRGTPLAAETGPLPSQVLQPALLEADPGAWEQTGSWLLGSMNTTMPGWQSGVFYTFVLDRRGRVVWARETPRQHFTLQAKLAVDGSSILVDENTFWSMWDFDTPSQVHRLFLDNSQGTSREILDANHTFTELPDGRLAWWAMPGDGEGELRVLEEDGSWRTVWSCHDFFDQHELDGSCLGNTVSWRGDDDSFLVSLALQDLVLHIDHATGQTLDSFGQRATSWDFDPPESGFWMQHGVAFTDTGTLLLSSHVSEDDDEGVVREYSLDPESQVLREVWSYGVGLGVSAGLGGEALRLPGGNTLHNYGTTPRVKEITPEGTVAWDVAWPDERLLGHTSWLEDLYELLPD